jgi:hypothetical protein
LRRGQELALQRLRRSLGQPKRAVDVFSALFARSIAETDAPLLGMATGESLACLNLLLHRGEALCDTDAQGVGWYRMREALSAAAAADSSAAPTAAV